MSNTQYTDKIKNVQPKVIKALKESIVSAKAFIIKKNKLYEKLSVDGIKNDDFKALEALGVEMESIIKKATAAINLNATTKLIGELDTSIVKVEKAKELGERLKASTDSESQEEVMKEIEQALSE